MTTMLGLLADTGSQLRANLMGWLALVMPDAVSHLVQTTVDEVASQASGGKLSFGVFVTLWAASNGILAIVAALNAAYGLSEWRPWWKVRLVSIGLTISVLLLGLFAAGLVLFGGQIGEMLAGTLQLGGVFRAVWAIAQWPVIVAFVLLAFALIYYFAPAVRQQRWYWITPGSVAGCALWLLVSIAFRLYLSYFDSYSKTYGSLGAVIIMMLWFYLSGASILIGGEVNSEIEHAAADAGSPDANPEGSPEERGRFTGARPVPA